MPQSPVVPFVYDIETDSSIPASSIVIDVPVGRTVSAVAGAIWTKRVGGTMIAGTAATISGSDPLAVSWTGAQAALVWAAQGAAPARRIGWLRITGTLDGVPLSPLVSGKFVVYPADTLPNPSWGANDPTIGAATSGGAVTTNSLSAAASSITSNVEGIAATLTPAAGTIAQGLGFDAAGALVKQAPTVETALTITDSNTIDLTASGTNGHTLTAGLRIDTVTPGNVVITSSANGVAAAVTFPADLRIVSLAASVTPGQYTATLSDASTFNVDLSALDEAPSTVIPPASSATGAIGTSANYARADHAHPTVVAYTAAGSAITVDVDGVAATLTPAAGTIADQLGFDAAGALVKQAPASGIALWVTATAYAIGDYVENPISNKLYRALTAHTSGASPEADVIAGNLVQVAQDVYT